MAGTSEGCAGKAVELPSHKVAKRVARERIHSQKDYVEKQHEGADSHSESSVEKETAERIAPQKKEKNESRVQKVAVQVLKNKREAGFATVAAFGWFADGARGWIEEKRSIVSLAIVVARDSEAQRESEDQQSGRKRPPAVMRVNERRVKRRKIRTPLVICALEGTQGSVNSERTEQSYNGQ
jgi:hypothetical protein